MVNYKKYDKNYMALAHCVSKQGTCLRKKVGCVIVLNDSVIGSGYNTSIDDNTCMRVGSCDIVHGHCVRTVHAEIQALGACIRNGISCKSGQIYITTYPCWTCFKALVVSGISSIFYSESYNPDPRIEDYIAIHSDICILPCDPLNI